VTEYKIDRHFDLSRLPKSKYVLTIYVGVSTYVVGAKDCRFEGDLTISRKRVLSVPGQGPREIVQLKQLLPEDRVTESDILWWDRGDGTAESMNFDDKG
jgi:hypothetical protein